MRVPHQNLTESFPELKEAYHYLKSNDAHFQNILNKYEEIDNELNKIENGGDAIDDFKLETMKKQRIAFKDDLYHQLVKYNTGI